MATRDNPYIENLLKRIDEKPILSPEDMARVLPLYVKAMNNNSVVNNISIAYIDNYDGKAAFKKFGRHFTQLYEMFIRNGIGEDGKREIFRTVAQTYHRFPTTVKAMRSFNSFVIQTTQKWMKQRKLKEAREVLANRFKLAVKKYLHLTYTLGFNEPSACAKSLAIHHKIDKYVLSGDFPLLLLPFLPEVEAAIKDSYEHYEMQDAWEVLKGRYFNHKEDYYTLALEIKSTFNVTVPNFSDYFDKIYTDTYYKMMLKNG